MRHMTDTDTTFGNFSTTSFAGRPSMMGRGWENIVLSRCSRGPLPTCTHDVHGSRKSCLHQVLTMCSPFLESMETLLPLSITPNLDLAST